MRKLLTAGVLAGGSLLAVPFIVSAQDDDRGWFADALTELVGEGTLTEEQAAAVQDALEEARPHGAPGHGHHDPAEQRPHAPAGGHRVAPLVLGAVADALAMDPAELADALREGQTIAEVAEAAGVDVQQLIDDLVAERAENLEERITDLVNETFPRHRHDHGLEGRDGD